ncbi:hypothetical protein JCM18897A_51550 [Streptomyces sp. JCM 18897]
MTLLLTRNDLETLLDPADCLAALREAFRTAGASPVPGQRVVTGLPFPGTAAALLPGLLPGVEAYTAKVNAKFPGARPALRGVVCLFAGWSACSAGWTAPSSPCSTPPPSPPGAPDWPPPSAPTCRPPPARPQARRSG